jgi:hypothetical protein
MLEWYFSALERSDFELRSPIPETKRYMKYPVYKTLSCQMAANFIDFTLTRLRKRKQKAGPLSVGA